VAACFALATGYLLSAPPALGRDWAFAAPTALRRRDWTFAARIELLEDRAELLLAKLRTFPLVSATQVITMKVFLVLKMRPDLA